MQYQTLLKTELHDVKDLMLRAINQIPSEISQAISQLVNRGGKQLRPSLVLLSCNVCNAPADKALYAAAAVEMLHTATLIHDDLIDNASTRRGTNTLNAVYSTAATVLSGDITFAIAARFAALSDNVMLVKKFAQTLEKICQGELNQMLNGHNSIPTVSEYFRRIEAKTASLFSLCTESGAILAGCSSKESDNAREFGYNLGLAFQIADDVLDFMGTENRLGKPVGGDLKEGLITLPVLHYYQEHLNDPRINAILEKQGQPEDIRTLVADLRNSDAADWSMQQANLLVEKALNLLKTNPATPYRHAMEEIARFAVQRSF
jgi:geranylgeranyl pyrophosphate synthase